MFTFLLNSISFTTNPTEVKQHFESELTNNRGDKVHITSPIVIFDQAGCKIVFAPTLEIYGYGQNEDEAKSSFEVHLAEFVSYTTNKGTFFNELKRLGWQVKKRKKKYTAPSFSKLLRTNEKLVDIMDHNDVAIQQKSFALPA